MYVNKFKFGRDYAMSMPGSICQDWFDKAMCESELLRCFDN